MKPRGMDRNAKIMLWLSGLVGTLMLLPLLLLIPIGAVWLWQNGLMAAWLAALIGLTLSGFGVLHLLRRRLDGTSAEVSEKADEPLPVSPPSPQWAPLDKAAWSEVQALARAAQPSLLSSHTLMLQSAREVVEQVAQHYFPGQPEPVWNFTLPEALLLSERVSQRVRLVLLDQVPASHMVQVGQVLRLWQFKSGKERWYRGARLAYRFVRLVNPVSALLAEAREQLLDKVLDSANQSIRRKIVRIWLEEVGRAAIDLYSGKLQADAKSLADLENHDANQHTPGGPVRILVAGQVNAGKSSLINALLQEAKAAVDVMPVPTEGREYPLVHEDETVAVLIDTSGLKAGTDTGAWVQQCLHADCVIWVVAAHRADRDLDHRGLQALHQLYRDNPQRSLPPILVAVSHVDRLSPAREWQPPYNLITLTQPKAQSISAALKQIADDLHLPETDLIPVRLDQGRAGYNLSLFWAVLLETLQSAQHNRAQRLQNLAKKKDWKKIIRQARSTGKLIKGSVSGKS